MHDAQKRDAMDGAALMDDSEFTQLQQESLQLLEAHASLTAKSQEMTSQLQKQQEYINSLVQEKAALLKLLENGENAGRTRVDSTEKLQRLVREIEQLGDALREKDKAMEEKQAAWEATERQYREQLHEGTSLQRLQHQKELDLLTEQLNRTHEQALERERALAHQRMNEMQKRVEQKNAEIEVLFRRLERKEQDHLQNVTKLRLQLDEAVAKPQRQKKRREMIPLARPATANKGRLDLPGASDIDVDPNDVFAFRG